MQREYLKNIYEKSENMESCGDNGQKDKNDDNENSGSKIKEMASVITHSEGRKIYCLTIVGQIEGHDVLPEQNKTTKYEHVIPRLVSIEEDHSIDGMLILINTVGGDVEAGLAISELIAGMEKPTVSIVLGGGHSIGVPLAVSAKRSFIVRSATMTIHPVRSNGLTVGAPQAFKYFERMQKRITDFVSSNSHISSDRFYELAMNTKELVTDVGTVLEGEAAVKEGLIDYIGSLSDALKCIYKMIDKNKNGSDKKEKDN